MKSDNPFQVGDWVETRPVAEVLATLDDQASTDALLFMPEMVRFCGHRFQVAEPVQRGRALRRDPVVPRLAEAVNLETYCDGSGHDGCEGRCLMFWNAAWLRVADGPVADQPPPPAEETAGIEWLEAAARLPARAGATRYRWPVHAARPGCRDPAGCGHTA
ncbi:MAG: hypothetical protein ACJ8AI_27780 [Rhodopila sp.]